MYLIDYLGRVLAGSHPQVARLVHQALLCHHLPSQVLVDSLIAVQVIVDILVQIQVLLQIRVNFQVQAQDFQVQLKIRFLIEVHDQVQMFLFTQESKDQVEAFLLLPPFASLQSGFRRAALGPSSMPLKEKESLVSNVGL